MSPISDNNRPTGRNTTSKPDPADAKDPPTKPSDGEKDWEKLKPFLPALMQILQEGSERTNGADASRTPKDYAPLLSEDDYGRTLTDPSVPYWPTNSEQYEAVKRLHIRKISGEENANTIDAFFKVVAREARREGLDEHYKVELVSLNLKGQLASWSEMFLNESRFAETGASYREYEQELRNHCRFIGPRVNSSNLTLIFHRHRTSLEEYKQEFSRLLQLADKCLASPPVALELFRAGLPKELRNRSLYQESETWQELYQWALEQN